ncbi:MAG: hypothetical protein FWD75_09265 [Propionibacteriaceae bacterium]|nr:hypothetical protein [Propionibacteriaceae bacterium]
MSELIALWWGQAGARRSRRAEQGSVTMENVIWALAVIAIAAIVVTAITMYVTSHSTELIAS